jgi:hypothetical protein
MYREAVTGNHIQQYRSGTFDRVLPDGGREWLVDGNVRLQVDRSGNMSCGGSFNIGSQVSGTYLASAGSGHAQNNWKAQRIYGISGCFAGDSDNASTSDQTGILKGPGASQVRMWPAYYWDFDQTTFNLKWYSNNTETISVRASDKLFANNGGGVAGVGAYVVLSDVRAKEDIAPTTIGLDEVMRLQPKSFTRTGFARPEIGFVAQDVAAVLPQAVVTAGLNLPDGTGGLEDEKPSLGITYDAIVAALVNAVKTLEARLAVLEGR